MPYLDGTTAITMPYGKPASFDNKIIERPVDGARCLKVRIAGAGVSGIIAAIKLQELVRNLDIQIFEKNSGLGLTWF